MGPHHIRRSKSKAPSKKAVAVNIITTFINHLLDARLSLSPRIENTKFRTTQRYTVMTERIRCVIELLAHQQKSSARTSHSR